MLSDSEYPHSGVTRLDISVTKMAFFARSLTSFFTKEADFDDTRVSVHAVVDFRLAQDKSFTTLLELLDRVLFAGNRVATNTFKNALRTERVLTHG